MTNEEWEVILDETQAEVNACVDKIGELTQIIKELMTMVDESQMPFNYAQKVEDALDNKFCPKTGEEKRVA